MLVAVLTHQAVVAEAPLGDLEQSPAKAAVLRVGGIGDRELSVELSVSRVGVHGYALQAVVHRRGIEDARHPLIAELQISVLEFGVGKVPLHVAPEHREQAADIRHDALKGAAVALGEFGEVNIYLILSILPNEVSVYLGDQVE